MLKALRLSALFLLLPSLALAQSSFEVADILSAPFPGSLTASSNEGRVAWVFNAEGSRNIWVADGPDYTGQQITHFEGDNGLPISNLIFTPDGQNLLYIHGDAPNRRGENPNPALIVDGTERAIWMVGIDGSEPRRITSGAAPALAPDGQLLAFSRGGQIWTISLEEDAEATQLLTIRGGAGSLRWSPDGSMLAFISNRGDHSFLGVYDMVSESVQYLDPSVDRDASPAWSPDGSRLAFMRFPYENNIFPFFARRSALPWSIHVVDVASGNTKEVWKAKDGDGSAFRGVSASNQLFWGADDRLVFPWEGDGWTHLYSVSANGGEAMLLTPGEFEVQFVSMTPDRHHMLYSSNQDDIDRQHVWQVNVTGGSPQAISSGTGIEYSPVMAGDGTILALASTGTHPAHPVKLSGGRSWLAPKAIPDTFPFDALVEPEQVIITSADGMKIHGQLFKPPSHQSGERYPAVLFFHGGSRRQMLLGFHHRGYYHNAYAMNQYMANQGYMVLSVNFRSGIGYGMKFREALNYGAGGASEFNDVVGAGLYMKSRPDVDPDRIGLWGGSYGGYLTALGLARASDLFAAGVDVHGVHDWNAVIQNFVPSYDPTAHPDVAELAYASSPMAFIKDWRSPVLLIHGDDDRNVPFSESVDLAEALRHQGVYFEQLIFPDEVHGFLLHRNWVAAYDATADFFNRMLK